MHPVTIYIWLQWLNLSWCNISRKQGKIKWNGSSMGKGPVTRYSDTCIMQLFVSWYLSVYTLNQVACFMQSLFTNCSRQIGESWLKTLSYKLRKLSICSFDYITSLLFSPFQSCFIYQVPTMCFYLLMML